MTKQCILAFDTLSVAALNDMLKVAEKGKLGAVRYVYSIPQNSVGPFSEWGIVFEKGIICSAENQDTITDYVPVWK